MDGARGARGIWRFGEAFWCSHVSGLFSLGNYPRRDVAAGPDVIRPYGQKIKMVENVGTYRAASARRPLRFFDHLAPIVDWRDGERH